MRKTVPERKKRLFKRTAAFLCAVSADILLTGYSPSGTVRICISSGMLVLLVLCFDAYAVRQPDNFLKVAYIISGLASGGNYSIICAFLLLYEVITQKGKEQ